MTPEPPAPANAAVRKRKIIATILVVTIVFVVWKVIDYRTQAPPPPHSVSEQQLDR